MSDEDKNAILKQTHDHAWQWFVLHANQRMQTVNFFLISSAFLFAAFGALLEKFPLAAFSIACLGAWVTLWFSRLDTRTKELISAGEMALKAYERHLAERSGIDEIQIIEHVEKPAAGVSSYRMVFKVIEGSVGAVFLVGALFAAATVAWTWWPGEPIIVVPQSIGFASAHDAPRSLAVWERGYAGSFMLENGCPGVVATMGSGPRWTVKPLAGGKCELTVHGERKAASVVRVDVGRP